MKLWYIKHYGARDEDDFVTNLKYQMIIQRILIINIRIDA